METYISILRGINVSGHKMIKMEELKTLFLGLDLKNVSTYIQSGNIVFQFAPTKTETLSTLIEKKIEEKYKFDVPVITRKISEFKTVIDKNPFLKKRGIDTDKLHVTFLNSIPKKENADAIKNFEAGADKFVLYNKEVYVYCPNGYGNTKLNNNFFEKKLKVNATTRNLRTVGELIKIAEGTQ
jgi:uncharacterized protein (DUF1697 family)